MTTVAMNTALMAIARRSSRVIFGVSEASSTAVSIGPMTAKKVVNAVSAVSSMAKRGFEGRGSSSTFRR